ncbi:aldolase/citrate lyase family protein [Halorubrum sp. GN11_10-6_MGM]|uniref:aldolase/citrate lyase family protein n=1 Tax=Halorubrum sp. GN11_10-6_MGM TaxID=2518112 RepID=UPI001F5460EF|nr:aldolase/citrate lyase family protein [Halorubrum sp. GN11_10-6_MGM]
MIAPKVRSPTDVYTVENMLEQVEVNNGLGVGAIGVERQIEDGEGIHKVREIAHSSDRLSSIIFGPATTPRRWGCPALTSVSSRSTPVTTGTTRYPNVTPQ